MHSTVRISTTFSTDTGCQGHYLVTTGIFNSPKGPTAETFSWFRWGPIDSLGHIDKQAILSLENGAKE